LSFEEKLFKSELFIVKYIHRYVGLYCLFLGYFTMFFLLVGEMFMDSIPLVAIVLLIPVIIISIFTTKETEDKIRKSFGFY